MSETTCLTCVFSVSDTNYAVHVRTMGEGPSRDAAIACATQRTVNALREGKIIELTAVVDVATFDKEKIK